MLRVRTVNRAAKDDHIEDFEYDELSRRVVAESEKTRNLREGRWENRSPDSKVGCSPRGVYREGFVTAALRP